jgi:hypothetical protein
MDLKNRRKIDPKKVAINVLGRTNRLIIQAEQAIDLANMLGSRELLEENAFFKEHISGKGWRGVPNNDGSSFATTCRDITSRLGLEHSVHNRGSLFVSGMALDKLINGYSGKWQKTFHVEHTIPNTQREKQFFNKIFDDGIRDAKMLAENFIDNQVVATVLQTEQDNKGGHHNADIYPFMKYKKNSSQIFYYDYEKGFRNAMSLTQADITGIYHRDPVFKEIYKQIDVITDSELKGIRAEQEEYVFGHNKPYHRIPKDLSIFIGNDLDKLEKIHYTHKPKNVKYKKSN